jgi:hypothetical protein
MESSALYYAKTFYQKKANVGAAFITSAFRVNPPCVYPERGRDECCPYIGIFSCMVACLM